MLRAFSRSASLLAAVAALVAQVAAADAPASDLPRLAIGKPVDAVRLEGRQFRGTPTRLAWSRDGTQLYVRISEFDRWSNETPHHVLFTVEGGRVEAMSTAPGWALRYWEWKSAPASPADPAMTLKVDSHTELVRTTNVPREGNIGQHTADPNAGLDEVARNAALASQRTVFETISLQGRVLDTAINRHVVPGRTFGWAPAPHALIAFVTEKGRLALMNAAGQVREVPNTKHVVLPAWSEDGVRIAFLQKAGDGWLVRLVDVGTDD